jgi:erythromycin esterase-like protein
MGAAGRPGPAGTVALRWAMHGPGWVRPAVRVAAAAAVLAALASCGLARSAATSFPGRGTPHRNVQAHGFGLPADAGAVFNWVSVNGLNGVAAVSAHSVWAVGSAATGKLLIEHWDGRAWGQVPSASPGGATESLLSSVAATGSSTAWAVGYYNTGKTIKTLIERWNGRGWAQVASPNPGGVHGSLLLGAAAAGSSTAWAVGYYSTGKTIKALIERWNGRGWVQVTSPSPGGSDARLNGVAAAGKSSAWAVGSYFGPSLRPLIERWNGRAWRVVTSPNPGGCCNALNAVTTIGESGAWAAGNTGKKFDEALIERWNGRAWQQVTSPRPAGSRGSNLTAIAARSPANAWAVGYYWADTHVDPAVKTLIERWNGRAWKQEPSPNPGGPAVHLPDQSLLQAVCTVSSSQAWAAGSYSSGSPFGKILIERRTGGTWSQVPAGR